MSSNSKTISVVGAGLAGCECALQLTDRGYHVNLFEMRGKKLTPAHKTTGCAELVCSNSFGSMAEVSGPGQLKWEASKLNSYILAAATRSTVPAGQAMAVDRELFSKLVGEFVDQHPRITRVEKIVESLDSVPRPTVIATGPLTDDALAKDMQNHFADDFLYFFDAISPIIDTDSIDDSIAWKAARWDKGGKDYYNCPMNKEEYLNFIEEIRAARKIEPKDFEKKIKYFEACMPIEVLAERGVDTPRFGPMKPSGLPDPRTDRWPYAVVQLRQDNRQGTAFNMVGFQTKMAYGEQTRVFRMIPGLQNAEFLKLGSIHKNLYINSPTQLNKDLSSKKDPELFFAGQITGVEGYFESTCIGLLVAHFLADKIEGKGFNPPARASAMGSILDAITDEERSDRFQPTNINFGLFPRLEVMHRDKKKKKEEMIAVAKEDFSTWRESVPRLHTTPQSDYQPQMQI